MAGAAAVSMATLTAIVTGGTTYKLSARGTAANAVLKAAAVDNSAGNLATQITWVRLA